MFIDLEKVENCSGERLAIMLDDLKQQYATFRSRVIDLCMEKASVHNESCASLFVGAELTCNCAAHKFVLLAAEIERLP